jgi:hypothetical protein
VSENEEEATQANSKKSALINCFNVIKAGDPDPPDPPRDAQSAQQTLKSGLLIVQNDIPRVV